MIGRLPPLSAIALELIADEKQRPPESAALKARLLERAHEAVAPDRPSGVALRPVKTSAWPGARRAPRAMLLAAAAVAMAGLAAAGAGIYRLQAPVQAPAVVRAPAEAPRAVTPPAPVESPPAPVAAPRAAITAPGAQRAAAPAESTQPSNVQQYAVELGLLEPARRSIGRGDNAGALAAIARHQREYPRGLLAEEREALRVRALWGMGQKAQAESAAASFRKRYPRSVLLSWMKEPAQ